MWLHFRMARHLRDYGKFPWCNVDDNKTNEMCEIVKLIEQEHKLSYLYKEQLLNNFVQL
jgi:hypothetical protein